MYGENHFVKCDEGAAKNEKSQQEWVMQEV